MPQLSQKIIQAYRAITYRLLPEHRVKTLDQAIEFVNQRGFIYFWPIRDTTLPSLWAAVAGDRPVADQHDDPGHITWGWKDSLLGTRKWYYAKILRKKATMVSMDIVKYFYALSENYGSYEDDYLTIYEQGRMTQEAKAVYEAILEKGPLDTIALRRAARLSSKENESRFNRALAYLQSDLKLVPVAVTQAGSWRYAFAYDIVARYYPEISEQARYISEREARQKLIKTYFLSVGVAQIRDVSMLFRWKPAVINRTLDELVQSGFILKDIRVENQAGEWIALSEFFDEQTSQIGDIGRRNETKKQGNT